MGSLDKYLTHLHEEAGEDNNKGDYKDARDDDDKLGKIYDMISEMYNHHKSTTSTEAKDVADEEMKKVEEDRTEQKKKE